MNRQKSETENILEATNKQLQEKDKIRFINNLPEELLERIFSFTSQYNDYINISLVCKKWHRIILGLIEINRKNFASCFQTGEIEWQFLTGKEDDGVELNYFNRINLHTSSTHQTSLNSQPQLHLPHQRHSHSSAIIGHKLYVFGGLSNTLTAYNDLWALDLNLKQWIRPITSGSYPSPKAAATFLARESSNDIILYGGYSHPYSYSLNQQVNFFDEFHVYSTEKNNWLAKIFTQETPKLAGHSASFIRNFMIIFGGCNATLGNKSNSIFCLDLDTYIWINTMNTSSSLSSNSSNFRLIDGVRPEARYGHSQTTLDSERILIVGGCGGLNKQFDDAWIFHWPVNLNLNPRWERVVVCNLINAPLQFYCVPFIRCCDNKFVTFGKARNLNISNTSPHVLDFEYQSSGSMLTIYGHVKKPRLRTCSCFDSVNDSQIAHETKLNREARKSDFVRNFGVTGDVFLNKSQINTIKRLQVLKKQADKFKHQSLSSDDYAIDLARKKKQKLGCVIHSKLMQVFVLDLSKCLSKNESCPSLNWQTPIAHFKNAPPDTVLFSLALGIDEILLFGGMEIDSDLDKNLRPSYEYIKHRVSNKLFLMKPRNIFNNLKCSDLS